MAVSDRDTRHYKGASHLFPAMHLQPYADWYLFHTDGAPPLRLLTGNGHADPSLSATLHGPPAALNEDLHAAGHHLSERELRCLEQVIAMQRWRR